MKRKDKMSKLEMPAPVSQQDEGLMLDDAELEMDLEDDMEDEEMESPMAEFSDEEIMEEMKARGLAMDSEEDDMEEDELEDLEV